MLRCDDGLDAVMGELCPGTDAREKQQLGGFENTSREYDFSSRLECSFRVVMFEDSDADSGFSLEVDLLPDSRRHHLDVGLARHEY